MVWLMEERGLRGRLVANGNRKPRVSIKPPSHSSSHRFMDVVTAMDCCPGDLMLLHKAYFRPYDIFRRTLILLNSFHLFLKVSADVGRIRKFHTAFVNFLM